MKVRLDRSFGFLTSRVGYRCLPLILNGLLCRAYARWFLLPPNVFADGPNEEYCEVLLVVVMIQKLLRSNPKVAFLKSLGLHSLLRRSLNFIRSDIVDSHCQCKTGRGRDCFEPSWALLRDFFAFNADDAPLAATLRYLLAIPPCHTSSPPHRSPSPRRFLAASSPPCHFAITLVLSHHPTRRTSDLVKMKENCDANLYAKSWGDKFDRFNSFVVKKFVFIDK